MFRSHRRVRYIGGALLRAAWRLVGMLPRKTIRGNALGKWWTSVGEWAYVHHYKCQCQPCQIIADYDKQFA